MEQTSEFRGKLLRLGRTARGMSQSQLADAAGISQPLVSLIEDGERQASNEQAAVLASALDFPISFFYREVVVFGPSLGEVFHRKRRVGKKQLNSYYAWTNIKAQGIAELLEPIEWPSVDLITPSVIDDQEVVRAARATRARWNVPQGPIESMSDLLSNAGIFVVPEYHGVDELDGMSVWVNGLPPIIFVNADMPVDRLRFTLAHELAHLTLHYRSDLYDISEVIEEQANLFASEFLMPRDEIKSQLRNLTLQSAAVLKRHWRTSMASVVMRAKDLGCITSTRAQELWRELSRRGWSKNEPNPLPRSIEQIDQTFHEALELNERMHPLSDDRLQKIFHVHPKEVRARLLHTHPEPRLRLVV